MKKNVLIILVLSLISFGSFAQRPNKMRERPTPDKMAEMQTKRLQEHLNLSEEQYQKVYALNLEKAKVNQTRMEQRQIAMKAERAAYNKKMESVLTPEQLTKLKEERAKAVKARGEYKGKRELKGKTENKGRTEYKKRSPNNGK